MHELAGILHKDKSEVLNFVGKHKSIYIYGKGYVGKYIEKYLNAENIRPKGFIVTNNDHDNAYDDVDLPVFSVNEIQFTEQDGIIIAVSEKTQREIATTLVELGVREDQIYGQKIICTNEGALINFSSKFKNYGDDNGDYFSRFSELDSIGVREGTDKSSQWHNYLNKYEFFLSQYRNEKIKVIELGILDGNSLRMWKKYFEEAEIYGVDIDTVCKKNEEDRIKIIIGDLDDAGFVQSLASINPHIIIEDASHSWSQQILILCTLYKSLPSGGVYILEDVETSFSAWKHRGYDDAVISGYEMCEAISKVVTGGELLNPREESAAVMGFKNEVYDIAASTAMVSFIHGSCILIRN